MPSWGVVPCAAAAPAAQRWLATADAERRTRAHNLPGAGSRMVEVRTADGKTALMLACAHGKDGCANLLIQAKASLTKENLDGRNALMVACRSGYASCVDALLRADDPAVLIEAARHVQGQVDAVDLNFWIVLARDNRKLYCPTANERFQSLVDRLRDTGWVQLSSWDTPTGRSPPDPETPHAADISAHMQGFSTLHKIRSLLQMGDTDERPRICMFFFNQKA